MCVWGGGVDYCLTSSYILLLSTLLHGCKTWTLLVYSGKKIQACETKCMRKLLRISYLKHKINDWVGSKINFLADSQEPLLATVKRRKLAWFGHVNAPTASPKPSFRARWRVDDAVVGRGNDVRKASKNRHICPCHNCSQEPPAQKTGRGSLLNRPSCPPDDSISQRAELN